MNTYSCSSMRLIEWIKVMGLQLNWYHDLGILLPSIATRQFSGQSEMQKWYTAEEVFTAGYNLFDMYHTKHVYPNYPCHEIRGGGGTQSSNIELRNYHHQNLPIGC